MKFIVPSPPDTRDIRYRSPDQQLRAVVDLREWASPVDDQGQLGSCASNATVNAYELSTIRQFPDQFADLSRLFVYYNTRSIEGTLMEDVGVANLRNAMKAVDHHGICTESIWPYSIERFTEKPSDNAYVDGQKRKLVSYQSLAGLDEICQSVNVNVPVVIGMFIYSEFYDVTKDNNVVDNPTSISYFAGGHAVCVVGYDLERQMLLVKNSVGPDWGDSGYCWLTFTYVKEQVFESWNFEIKLT